MRVPTRTVKRIDEWARTKGLDRSEALRRIMQAGAVNLGVMGGHHGEGGGHHDPGRGDD